MDVLEGIFSIVRMISGQFLMDIPIFESLIVADGIVNAMVFAKELYLHKVSERKMSKAVVATSYEEIVQRCQNIYVVPVLDRYIFYYILAMIAMCTGHPIPTGLLCITIPLPYIQNSIARIGFVRQRIDGFQTMKGMFARYSLSKLIVKYVSRLDEGIDEIKNYHIFVIYKHISYQYCLEFIKSYIFIYFLYFLRGHESTYYYYKAIKFSYYYNSGYLFNIMKREDAIGVLNIVIHEKRWRDMYRVDIVNAIYSLTNDGEQRGFFDLVVMNIAMYKFFALWSGVCLLRMLDMYSYVYRTLYVGMAGVIWTGQRKAKSIFLLFVVHTLMMLNTNDLIITLLIFLHEMLYYIIQEIVFFSTNYKDICKVVNWGVGK
jgi:hypothetical protein